MNKKAFSIVWLIMSLFLLIACKDQAIEETPHLLPNLTGLNKAQAISLLDELDINYTFVDIISNDIRVGRFVSYQEGYTSGMEVEKGISLIIYFVGSTNTLPDLTGLSQEDIIERMNLFDFNFSFLEVETDLFEEGIFISYTNNHFAGETLPLGTEITIRIAKTKDMSITLPNLQFLNEQEISNLLNTLSINYTIEEIENNLIPERQFVSYQEGFVAGDIIQPHQDIIIYIAKFVNRLPDLTQKNQTQILQELSRLQVVSEIRTIATNDVPEGQFVSYLNREAGQIVSIGASVIVYVATPIIVVNRNLMFSTYVEGTLFNKALELYNLSDDIVDLSEFTIAQYLDGSQEINIEFELEGFILPKSVYVIAHSDAIQAIKQKADMITDQLFFNGNDSIALIYSSGETVDKIEWIIQYLDNRTLSRKAQITSPSPNFNYFDWDIYSNDNHQPLGSHPTAFPTTFTYNSSYLSIPFPENGGMIKVTFISNNDGDTAQFSPGFTSDDRVRFVGIDTAETGSGTLATLARQFVYQRLNSATEIYLQQDPSSGVRETFGRYLALVWADGVLLNYELIKYGYAANAYFDSARTFSLNGVDLNTWMLLAEQYAKTNRLGMWG